MGTHVSQKETEAEYGVSDGSQHAGSAAAMSDVQERLEKALASHYAVERELGLDRGRTNVHGGAIAIGHPVGASGARITLHLLHALRREGKQYGLGSACVGGGQGFASLFEAC